MKTIFFIWSLIKFFFISSLSVASPGRDNVQSKNTTSVKTEAVVINLTESDFRRLIYDYENNKQWKYEGSKPAIIDFYADWCAPCRQLSPEVEKLAKDYSGKIVVYKVDTDKEQKLAQKIGITALPTLLFIPVNGKPQVTMGALPRDSLEKAVKDILLVK
jgi:thioredoxin